MDDDALRDLDDRYHAAMVIRHHHTSSNTETMFEDISTALEENKKTYIDRQVIYFNHLNLIMQSLHTEDQLLFSLLYTPPF